MKYEARGSVRGSCGHGHRTIKAAEECAMRDRLACAKLGGGAYSDRIVCRVGGEPLNQQEIEELWTLQIE